MRSNYKPLGDYIQKVEHRNRDLKVTRLLGLSMTKEFRETTSNIVGTDMSVYRVMSKYQFACDFMSPIRVNKLPVVLKLDDEPNLVSPAYPVFKIGSSFLVPIESSSKISNLKPIFKLFENSFCNVEDKTSALS